MDKKLMKLIGILVGLILLFIIFMVITNSLSGGKKHTYDEVVNKAVAATKKYLSDNPSRKPNANNTFTNVSFNLLVEEKYLKSASDLFKNKDASCYGDVSVYYLEDNKYDYIPEITCNVNGENKVSKNLSNTIIGDGEVNVVLTGSGLYKRINGNWVTNEEDLNSGASDDDVYYFYRGNEKLQLNNFLQIDDMLFRIVMIDNYGNMLLMYNSTFKSTYYWDKRYNQDVGKQLGVNTYVEGGVKSAAMQKLESFYEGKEILANKVEFSKSLKYITEQFDLCIGKRGKEETGTDGSVECATKVENQKVEILPAYMFMSASLDPTCNTVLDKSCGNNNYLANNSGYWLLTAEKERSNYCYYVNGAIISTYCSTNLSYKPMLMISSRVQYTEGTGSETDPYILNTTNYVSTKK